MNSSEENTTNAAAELGTAVHEMTEVALKWGLSCDDFLGCTFNKIVMTEKEVEAGNVYVNYIRQLKQRHPNGQFYYEVKVCLSSIADDLWGTADFIMIDGRTMYSLDYKNGYELVEVNKPQLITGYGTINGNAQNIGYALAAMDTFQLWGKVDTIIAGIIQPNNDDHIDGIIRLKQYSYDEVVQWHQAYRASYGRNDLVAGSWCKYCPSSGRCAVRIRQLMESLSFETPITELNEDQVISLLPMLSSFSRNIKAIQERANTIARQGKKLKDYKLVREIVHGYCVDEEKFINEAVQEHFAHGVNKLTDDSKREFIASLYNKPRIKGMTACKKVLSKELVNKHYNKPEAGLALVPITAKGAAVMPDKRPSSIGEFEAII